MLLQTGYPYAPFIDYFFKPIALIKLPSS